MVLTAVKGYWWAQARAKELRAELLNSKRLEAHFEAHPGTDLWLMHVRCLLLWQGPTKHFDS